MSIRTTILTGAALAFALPAVAADSNLIVLDWAGWDIPGIMEGYIAKHGDKPTYSFFADDDEAFQKLSSGFKADIVHPCGSQVGRYRDAGLIEPWDTSKIPEFANLAPRFLESPVFNDEGGLWFLPYDYAYTAVAYNAKEVPEEDVATLQVFANPKYAGRISLPDSSDDVWALAFGATGLTNWDNVTDEQFQAAADWLRAVHPNVRAYWTDPSEMAQLMASGEVLVAQSWNDGVALLKAEGFPVGYQRSPKEGSSTFICGFVNVKDGPGDEERAYDFINSALAHSSAVAVLNELGYAISNDAAMAEIAPETLAAAYVDPVTTPLFMQSPVSPELRAKMIEEFEQIKAGF
ncbi:MAG: extracellular solute-binding protein [Gemmobacter sp.]|jgi:spermidine/putrescine transport system substrate-binding protein|nr:extracellular solute-binding protein [Gemmobacter sp.]